VTGVDAPQPVRAESAYPVIAPSARVRIEAFRPYLLEHGVDLSFRGLLDAAEYDAVVSPGAPLAKAATLTRSALRAARRGSDGHAPLLIHRLRALTPVPRVDPPARLDFYDFDDALYLGSTSAANDRFGWVKREAQRWHAYVTRARVVIAGNDHLAEQASRHASRVVVIPSCVEPAVQPMRKHVARDPVVVGWIGSASTAAYLTPVLSALERLNADRMRCRLVLVGAGGHFDAPWIEQRPWALEREVVDLASFDIGVMPLPDTAWARGKCGYKLLRYFAAGVPAVASPVGVNPGMVGDDRGLLARTVEEWSRALAELAADPDRRRDLGACARDFVERDYSYERWAPELAGLLREHA
jgi:glycosyltransferase involved in cell wall biosynthesis